MTNSNDTRSWIDTALERRLGLPTLLVLPDATLVDGVTRELVDALRTRRYASLLAAPGQGMPQVFPPLMAINPGPVYDPVAMQKAAAQQYAQSLARMLIETWAVLSCRDVADVERHAKDWERIQLLGACVIVAPGALLDRWPHAGRRIVVDST